MNFDIKDVKTWKDRHDVKVGDKGYISNDLDILRNDLKRGIAQIKIICHVRDNDTDCFAAKTSGIIKNYGFFLPSEAVKADKPKEKKYRPLKKIKDFHDCGVIKGEDDCLIGSVLTLRDKKNYNLTRDMEVTDVEYSFDTVLRINRCSLAYFFTYFDIYINGEWVPFGVEVEEDE